MHYIIGIDEAGRGPWAGPIVAGGFMIESSHFGEIPLLFPRLDDSKKLKEKQREEIYGTIEYLAHKNTCQYTFSYREASRIDEIGIRNATKECMEDIIVSLTQYLSSGDTYEIWIDGCDNFTFESFDGTYSFAKKKQKKKIEPDNLEKNILSYIIQGDSLHDAISLASIIAKVLRDRMMCEYSEDFPGFTFQTHKGYGTRKHQEELLNYGINSVHRKSYAPVKRLISEGT